MPNVKTVCVVGTAALAGVLCLCFGDIQIIKIYGWISTGLFTLASFGAVLVSTTQEVVDFKEVYREYRAKDKQTIKKLQEEIIRLEKRNISSDQGKSKTSKSRIAINSCS